MYLRMLYSKNRVGPRTAWALRNTWCNFVWCWCRPWAFDYNYWGRDVKTPQKWQFFVFVNHNLRTWYLPLYIRIFFMAIYWAIIRPRNQPLGLNLKYYFVHQCYFERWIGLAKINIKILFLRLNIKSTLKLDAQVNLMVVTMYGLCQSC